MISNAHRLLDRVLRTLELGGDFQIGPKGRDADLIPAMRAELAAMSGHLCPHCGDATVAGKCQRRVVKGRGYCDSDCDGACDIIQIGCDASRAVGVGT